MRIVHLTSVHNRYDTRIFYKQCCSLVELGLEVFLVVADGRGDEVNSGVSIIDAGIWRNRMSRMFFATRSVYKKAIQLDADVYHIHDPELIVAGLKLRGHGKIIIYDAHEDLPLQILSKPYLWPAIRRLLSWCATVFERYTLNRFHQIITATPHIRAKYEARFKKVTDINNYPIVSENEMNVNISNNKKAKVCYIGGFTRTRGLLELIEAMNLVKNDVSLSLAGFFFEHSFENEIFDHTGWEKVNYHGFLNRESVRELLSESLAGIVTLHPVPNYLNSQPVKMFEYMEAGLPVIASDFPAWREILDKYKCGICVNPLNPSEIAKAIDDLVENTALRREMGANGRKLVIEEYNWKKEEQKLYKLYINLQNETV